MFIEEVVCVEPVVAKELIPGPVELVRPRAGNYVNLGAAAAAEFRIISSTNDLEFRDGVDARKREQREIRTAVNVIGAVDRPVILAGARAADGKRYYVRSYRRKIADVKLVGS